MISDGLDWLEIRVSTLSSSVDYFVILESPLKFTRLEKKLLLRDNWDKFKYWHGKMICHILEGQPVAARKVGYGGFPAKSYVPTGVPANGVAEQTEYWGRNYGERCG